jgi:hypothetical protein
VKLKKRIFEHKKYKKMNTTQPIENLNKHQLEILKLFTRDLEDNDLIEIKRLIVKYLANKITKMADDIWEEKNWTNDDMDRLLLTHK